MKFAASSSPPITVKSSLPKLAISRIASRITILPLPPEGYSFVEPPHCLRWARLKRALVKIFPNRNERGLVSMLLSLEIFLPAAQRCSSHLQIGRIGRCLALTLTLTGLGHAQTDLPPHSIDCLSIRFGAPPGIAFDLSTNVAPRFRLFFSGHDGGRE